MAVVFRTAEGNMSMMPELITNVLAEKVDYLVVSSFSGMRGGTEGDVDCAGAMHFSPGQSDQGGADIDA